MNSRFSGVCQNLVVWKHHFCLIDYALFDRKTTDRERLLLFGTQICQSIQPKIFGTNLFQLALQINSFLKVVIYRAKRPIIAA